MIPEAVEKYVYHREPGIVLLHGNCQEILPQLELESIQCCVTSPPYWGLRDYGEAGQLGLERTPEEYTAKLTEIFSLVNSVLKPDGTLWLNLGDSYATGAGKVGKCPGGGDKGLRFGHIGKAGNQVTDQENTRSGIPKHQPNRMPIDGLKPKDLVGIPWRVAFALQADGWYLRSDIIEEVEFYCPCGCGHILEERIVRYAQDRDLIWYKPNPMPESVQDRPTKAHEYLFLMSKSSSYYYDNEAIQEPQQVYERNRRLREQQNGLDREYTIASDNKTGQQPQSKTGAVKNLKKRHQLAVKGTRNKRSVWTISTRPYPGAHFAVFPPELVEPCILAGTKEGDIVIDPFGGSQTVGYVCKKHKRRYIGIDISSDYLDLGPERIGAQGIL